MEEIMKKKLTGREAGAHVWQAALGLAVHFLAPKKA